MSNFQQQHKPKRNFVGTPVGQQGQQGQRPAQTAQPPRLAIPPDIKAAIARERQGSAQPFAPSNEYADRYSHIEREADSQGRIWGVGRLRVSQQIRVMEMTPNLEGYTENVAFDANGNKQTYQVPRRSLPMLAAAVREVDGKKIMFPQSRAHLDAIMDQLDEHGFSAVITASNRLSAAPLPTAPALSEEEQQELDEEYGEEDEAA
jgi:hypothetical protein